MDTSVYEYVLTRATVENNLPYYQPAHDTSPYSISTPRIYSTSGVYPSAVLDFSFTSYFKRPNMIGSMQECVKKTCYDCASYIC